MNTIDALKNLLLSDFEIEPSTLRPETTFAEVGLDSLGMAEFMFLVEDLFHIDFAAEQSMVQTVGELVATIDRLRSVSVAVA